MDVSKHAPLRINDIRSKYKVVDKVGKGSYGTVFKVLNLQDNKYYAIKKFENTEAKLQVEGFPITALREISLLKQLNHPNIVNLQQIICSKPNKRNLFRGSTFMVFEYMHHDFAGLFRSKIKFSLPEIKCIMKQILLGCSFLHKNKVMHRDIKSANILLNDQGIVQLADFGLGRRTRFDSVYTYKVVTLWYRAPQLLLGCKTYNHKVDVWSIGCVFAELLTGQVLFKKQTEYAIIEKIYEICGDLDENEYTEDYLRGCVYYNDMRPKKSYENTLQALIRKMNPNIDDLSLRFLKGLLQLNPYKRFSCQEALDHQFFKEQPQACKPQQIHKLEVEYHEMFRDRSMKIERKARKQSLNWSDEEQLRKGKKQNQKSQDKKTNRYEERQRKQYTRQRSYNDRPVDKRSYNSRYESRYDERRDDRRQDYSQKEYYSSKYQEDTKYKKRHSKSRSKSPRSSSSSRSKSSRSRSRNTKRYYEDKRRDYRKEDRQRGEISSGRKETSYYEDRNRDKDRSYISKQKLPQYSSKSYDQKKQSYKKEYPLGEESKAYRQKNYESKDRKEYSRNDYNDRKQYSSRNDRYSKPQNQKIILTIETKQKYPDESKPSKYNSDKYEPGEYRGKEEYKSRGEQYRNKSYDYRYDEKYQSSEYRNRKEERSYKDQQDRYGKSYSKEYRTEYTKKQPYIQQKYSDEKRSYQIQKERQYRQERPHQQYDKGSYDYSKKPQRYINSRYRDDSRYPDQPRYKDREDSRYRDENKSKEYFHKKLSIQSRQSTQKKRSSPNNKAMDVQEY